MFFSNNSSTTAFSAIGALALSAVMFATAIVPATPNLMVLA